MPKQNKKSIAASKAGSRQSRSVTSIVIIVVCAIVLLAAIAVAVGCLYLYNFDFAGTIMENVTVAGVDVGGMTRSEAISAVTEATRDTYSTTPMVIQVFDTRVEILPEVSKASLQVKSAVWEAYRYGRRGFSSQQESDQNAAANGGITVDISPYLSLDEQAIRAAMEPIAQQYSATLSQSSYEVTGTAPELTLVVHLGTPEYGLNMDTLYQEVLDAYSRNTFLLETECTMIEPDPIDLAGILEEYAVEPVDASFNKETFDVIDGINGCGFDIETVQATLAQSKYGQTVEIPFDVIAPQTTGETLSAMLFRDELGTHTATQSSSANRTENLRLACEAVNGVILYPGDVFSYNETLGERTEEKGYKPGASYSGGETITTIGGGICQVSSTIYYCALQADLEILTRENHAYAPGYVPLGMDATVSWGALDFRFKNNTDYPIRIDATADGGSTTVKLMGTDTKDYYVKMEYAVTATHNYSTTYKTMSANNAEGYRDGDYIVSPYVGYDVTTYRCKYSKETDELISKDYEATSYFSKRDAVVCKIEDGSSGTTTTPPAGDTPGIGNGGVTEDGGALPEP